MKLTRLLFILVLSGILLNACKPLINGMVFHPDTDYIITKNELLKGIEEFTVVTNDGVTLTNLYLPVMDSEYVLLYFHGNAGNIYHRIPDLLHLRQFGVSVIGVSYRGYGQSEGSPSELGIYQDAVSVYNYVKDELDYATENIFIFGRSIGTTVAINVAQYKKTAGLILVTPFTNAKALAKTTGLSLLAPLAGDAFKNKSKIKNIKSALLIIHGTKDQIIPQEMAQEIYDEANRPKEIIFITGANHNNLQSFYGRQYWKAIHKFIKLKLKQRF